MSVDTHDNTDKLESLFDKERIEISNFIETNITEKLKLIDNVPEIQVNLLSQRQRLIDKSAELRTAIRKKNKKVQSVRKSKFRFYKLEYDLKLNDYEIKNHIEADVEESTNVIKVLENQLQYYKDSIDLLDKCSFAIKHLIEVKKFLSGGY
jgi:hypothetical protein